LFGRNDNPCGYDTIVITLLRGKRFGTLAISDHQHPLKGQMPMWIVHVKKTVMIVMTQKYHYWWVEPLLSKFDHFLNACTNKCISRKKCTKDNYKFLETIFTRTLRKCFEKLWKLLQKIAQTGSHWIC